MNGSRTERAPAEETTRRGRALSMWRLYGKILPPRLEAAAELIPGGCGVADVGTDHGLLPVWLALRGENTPVIASDLRPGPLSRAVENANRCGLGDKIRFLCSDGLSGITPGEAGCVVCCGMGGETIRDIILAASWLKSPDTTLVLQPQSKLRELIKALSREGWSLLGARLSKDAGRVYPVFSVRWTGEETGWDEDTLVKRMSEEKQTMLPEWLEEQVRRLEKALKGAETGKTAGEETEQMRQELQRLRRLMEETGK